jgi:hypothetical protein
MNITMKSLVVVLFAAAAVKFYPDFARYLKIRAM